MTDNIDIESGYSEDIHEANFMSRTELINHDLEKAIRMVGELAIDLSAAFLPDQPHRILDQFKPVQDLLLQVQRNMPD